MNNQTPTDVYGHILINTQKLKNKFGPRKKGDLWWMMNWSMWIPIRDVGTPFSDDKNDIFLRPIDVGEGYELVKEGEEIKSGDEYMTALYPDRWDGCASTIGHKASCNGDEKSGGGYLAFRRKKPKEKETWIVVVGQGNESFPTEEEAIIAAKERALMTNAFYTVAKASQVVYMKHEVVTEKL